MANVPLDDCLPINWVRVNVYQASGANEPLWLIAPQEECGTECFIDEKPSYISAMVEALSFGLPVYYRSGRV